MLAPAADNQDATKVNHRRSYDGLNLGFVLTLDRGVQIRPSKARGAQQAMVEGSQELTAETEQIQPGISILAARIRTLIYRSPSRTARFLRRTFFQFPIPAAQPALELEPKIPEPFSDTSAPLRS